MVTVSSLICLLACGCSDEEAGVPPVTDMTGTVGSAGQAGLAAGAAGGVVGSAGSAGVATAGAPPATTGGQGGGMPPAVDAGGVATPDAGPGGGVDASAQPDAAEPMAQTGTLPVPDALDDFGPYEVEETMNTGPGNLFTLYVPQPLGEDGLKHPVLAWSPGAGASPPTYLTFLNAVASHGFVVLSYNATAQGTNLVDAIDWLIAENERSGSELYGMLDTDKIAAGGHSAGSLATYQMADDPRLTTTLHMSGGSFTPTVDVPRLMKPALMVCGDPGGDGLITGDLANPMCLADFQMATVPVFYAVVVGAGHTALNDAAATLGIGTENDDPNKWRFIRATVGWLRWQLAGDESLKSMFVGDDCELCTDSGYMVMQKNLD